MYWNIFKIEFSIANLVGNLFCSCRMRKTYIYWLLLVVLMAFLGWATWIFTKIAVREISPFWFTFLRFVFASLFMVPFVFRKIPKENLLKLVLLSLFAAWNVLFFAFGIQYTNATSSSIIYVLSPIIALLCWYVFLKQKFTMVNILWILLWFLWAVFIILLPVLSVWNYSIWSLIGNLLIVCGMISFTIYTVWSKSSQKLFSPQAITAWFLFVTLIFTGCLSLIHPQQFMSEVSRLSVNAWLAVIFVWLAWTGVQYLLQQMVIKKDSYVNWSLFLYLQPVAVVVLAVPILHERITYLFVIGAIVTLAGVWLSSKKHLNP